MVELFPRFTQETRLLRLLTPLGADELLVEWLRGEESVSSCFSLQLSVLSTDAHIKLKSLLGRPALVELLTANPDMKWRPFHGYVTSAECVGANGGFARYRITIEPWCAFLKLGRDSRMFQDKSVFEILGALIRTVADILDEPRYSSNYELRKLAAFSVNELLSTTQSNGHLNNTLDRVIVAMGSKSGRNQRMQLINSIVEGTKFEHCVERCAIQVAQATPLLGRAFLRNDEPEFRLAQFPLHHAGYSVA